MLAHPPMTTPYTASESDGEDEQHADVEVGDLERPAVGDVGGRDERAVRRSLTTGSAGRRPCAVAASRSRRPAIGRVLAGVVRDVVRRLLPPAPRDDGDADDHRGDHDRRREREEDLVDVLRAVVFLQDELQPVRQRLAEAEHVLVLQHGMMPKPEPDAVGADAVLHPRRDLALQQDQVRHRPEHREVHDERDVQPRRGEDVDDEVFDRVEHGNHITLLEAVRCAGLILRLDRSWSRCGEALTAWSAGAGVAAPRQAAASVSLWVRAT